MKQSVHHDYFRNRMHIIKGHGQFPLNVQLIIVLHYINTDTWRMDIEEWNTLMWILSTSTGDITKSTSVRWIWYASDIQINQCNSSVLYSVIRKAEQMLKIIFTNRGTKYYSYAIILTVRMKRMFILMTAANACVQLLVCLSVWFTSIRTGSTNSKKLVTPNRDESNTRITEI